MYGAVHRTRTVARRENIVSLSVTFLFVVGVFIYLICLLFEVFQVFSLVWVSSNVVSVPPFRPSSLKIDPLVVPIYTRYMIELRLPTPATWPK